MGVTPPPGADAVWVPVMYTVNSLRRISLGPTVTLCQERCSPCRTFSLAWLASMQIYWTQKVRLHKERFQLPQDWFRTPTWPSWRHVKIVNHRQGLDICYTHLCVRFWDRHVSLLEMFVKGELTAAFAFHEKEINYSSSSSSIAYLGALSRQKRELTINALLR